ncbi:MAG: RNA methyltransferase [Alistipes sp.]|nr:RNA methyltransferase [Alistipes sp.]
MTSIASRLKAYCAGHSKEWYNERTAYLETFLTEERIEVLRCTLSSRTRYMTILTENTFHPQNASALVRHCEAFGLQDLHTVETRCKFSPNVNIVRGTDKWVDLTRHDSTEEAIAALKGAGYRLVATTPHRESCTPETFDVERGPFCLVFGTEHAGVSDEIIEAADEYLRIPMCGMVESLNVSASAAILIYMLSQRMRLSPSIDWRLKEDDAREMLFRWVMSSVKDSQRILERQFPL